MGAIFFVDNMVFVAGSEGFGRWEGGFSSLGRRVVAFRTVTSISGGDRPNRNIPGSRRDGAGHRCRCQVFKHGNLARPTTQSVIPCGPQHTGKHERRSFPNFYGFRFAKKNRPSGGDR